MPTNFAYNLGIPNGPNNPSNDQPNMKINTNSINSIIGVDHLTFETATGGDSDGYHTVIHLVNQSSDPALGVEPQLYSKTSTFGTGGPQLFFEGLAPGSVSQLTGNHAASPGYVIIAGLVFQWGSITGTPIVDGQAVTFFTSFIANVFSVTLGPTSNSTNDKTISITTGSVGLGGFTVSTSNTSSFQTLYYMAIGN